MGLWETITLAGSRAAEARSWLTVVPAVDYLRGALDVAELPNGWQRPVRVQESVLRALTSCEANHPGLFRQMASATSGMCLRLATDASELAVAVRLDREPRGTADVLEACERVGGRRPYDGVSCWVDGRRLGCQTPRLPQRALPWLGDVGGMGIACFDLRDPKSEPGEGVMALPGLGKRHEVCIWLPCLRGCDLRELWLDGTYVEALPARPSLLVLGDSIGQGFCADDPAGTWPALLAERLGLDLLNQSIGGQVLQASTIPHVAMGPNDRIVVELGANYRWDPRPRVALEHEVRAYLGGVRHRWPNTPTWVVTPLWHDEESSASKSADCLQWVASSLAQAATEVGARLVEGAALVDADPALFADGEHPGPKGHAQMASRLCAKMRHVGKARRGSRRA